jgi:hypothetical protein
VIYLIATAIGASLIGLGVLAVMAGISLHRAFDAEPVTDPARYSAVISELKNSGYDHIPHFPAVIPNHATQIDFYYGPHILQSPLSLRLRYSLPADEFRTVVQRIASGATMAPATDNEALWFDQKLPPGFQRYILGQKDRGGDKGYAYGIAANASTHELLFWTLDD